MCLYAMLLVQSQGNTNMLTALAVGTVTYLLSLYLYYGIARLAYLGHDYLLLVAGVASVTIVIIGGGVARMIPGLISCGAVLAAGTVIGRMTRHGILQQRVYVAGMLVVAAFAIGQFYPLWKPVMKEAPYLIEHMESQMETISAAMGFNAEAIRSNAESVRPIMAGFFRLVPMMTILADVMTFSLGYLAFAFIAGTETFGRIRVAPFAHWKMPLWVMPVFTAVIIMRLLGSDLLVLAADNIIAFVAFYYAITGLALAEFYMRKLHFTRYMRIMLYIVLLLTQLYGLVVTALLGFIDSYADWRKIQQLSLARQ